MGCAEFLTMTVAMQTVLRYGHIEQGQIGEQIATDIAVGHLGMSKTEFTPAKHGIDGLFRDNNGNLVVADSKCMSGSPFTGLHSTNHGPQLSHSWIAAKAECMQNPNSAQYSPQNAKLGAEIQAAIKNGSLRTMLVHTNPETQQVTAYELRGSNVRSSNSWETVATGGQKNG